MVNSGGIEILIKINFYLYIIRYKFISIIFWKTFSLSGSSSEPVTASLVEAFNVDVVGFDVVVTAVAVVDAVEGVGCVVVVVVEGFTVVAGLAIKESFISGWI